jgi:hypothetical protein
MGNSSLIAAELTRALSGDPDTTSLEAKSLELGIPAPKKIEMPISVHSESDINWNKPHISTQKFNTKIGNFEIDYDLTSASGNDPEPSDVIRLGIPEPFNIGNSQLNIRGVGNWTKNDLAAVEFFKSVKAGEINLGFDFGQMMQKGVNPLQWAYADATKGNLYAMAASLYPSNISKANLKNSDFIGILGTDFLKNFYASVGGSTGPRMNNLSATANTHGLENFGTLGFAVYNPKEGNFFFKTRTAVGDVNQDFYKPKFGNFVNGLFVFPPFSFPHFTPAESKGNLTLMVDGKGTKEDGLTQSEIRVGGKTPFGMIGAGIYDGEDGPVPSFMYYTPFKMDEFEGSIEITGNPTNGLGAYLTLNTNLGSK